MSSTSLYALPSTLYPPPTPRTPRLGAGCWCSDEWGGLVMSSALLVSPTTQGSLGFHRQRRWVIQTVNTTVTHQDLRFRFRTLDVQTQPQQKHGTEPLKDLVSSCLPKSLLILFDFLHTLFLYFKYLFKCCLSVWFPLLISVFYCLLNCCPFNVVLVLLLLCWGAWLFRNQA